MLSNYPPGVTEDMIPGSRPEDQEKEFVIVFAEWEIDDLRKFLYSQKKLDIAERHELWPVIENILEQIEEVGSN